MAQTKDGAIVVAASKCGVSVVRYKQLVASGQKHCYECRSWKPIACYGKDSARYDGLAAICSECRKEKNAAKYKPRPRVSKLGSRFVPARSGDKIQARARVNLLIRTGRLARPAMLPCFDCGHTGSDRRHEYDHFEGYAGDKQECVQVVCCKCHSKRSHQRGEAKHYRNRGRFTKKGGSINGCE